MFWTQKSAAQHCCGAFGMLNPCLLWVTQSGCLSGNRNGSRPNIQVGAVNSCSVDTKYLLTCLHAGQKRRQGFFQLWSLVSGSVQGVQKGLLWVWEPGSLASLWMDRMSTPTDAKLAKCTCQMASDYDTPHMFMAVKQSNHGLIYASLENLKLLSMSGRSTKL